MNNTIFDRENFVRTKEYRRFEEFANACEKYRYIGLCYGKPGLGKTFSARYYAEWDAVENYQTKEELDEEKKQKLRKCKALFHTAQVTTTPKRLQEQLYQKLFTFGNAYSKIYEDTELKDTLIGVERYCSLVIIDEADSLNYQSIEQLRYLYDKYNFGLILVGMPGIEKRLARYPQLYSRVGFAHEFSPLSQDEIEFIFTKNWKQLGLELDKEQFSNVEAIKTIAHITQGNFRLIQRIFSQINRIKEINNLKEVNKEVVMAARNCLVIGQE